LFGGWASALGIYVALARTQQPLGLILTDPVVILPHPSLFALQEKSTNYSLKCNISQDVNYLHQGLTLGLVEDR